MKTVLYDTINEKLVNNKVYDDGYKVDGVPQSNNLPNGIVELEYIDIPKPVLIPSTNKITGFTWIADIVNNRYYKKWNQAAKTAEDIALEDWLYPEYPHRIVIDPSVIFTDVGVKFHTYFKLQERPIVNVGSEIHVYSGGIQAEHQQAFTDLANQGLISLENRPSILD